MSCLLFFVRPSSKIFFRVPSSHSNRHNKEAESQTLSFLPTQPDPLPSRPLPQKKKKKRRHAKGGERTLITTGRQTRKRQQSLLPLFGYWDKHTNQ